MISCSFILAEFSMLLRERMKLIGWFLSHDLLCACGILKSLDVFISMRRGRAWKKRARRTATASLPLWVRIPRVYIWNNEFERAKDAICEWPPIPRQPLVFTCCLRRLSVTLCHSAWVPRWDVLGLNGLKLLCLNWQDLKHVRIKKLSWGSSTGLIVKIVLGGWNPPKKGLEPPLPGIACVIILKHKYITSLPDSIDGWAVSEITTCQSVVGFLTRTNRKSFYHHSHCRLTAGVRLPSSGWLKIWKLVFINLQGNVSELIDARAPLDRCWRPRGVRPTGWKPLLYRMRCVFRMSFMRLWPSKLETVLPKSYPPILNAYYWILTLVLFCRYSIGWDVSPGWVLCVSDPANWKSWGGGMNSAVLPK